MSRKFITGIAIVLGLFVIACGTSSTGSGQTIVPATSAQGTAQATTGSTGQTTIAPVSTEAPTEAPVAVAKIGDRVELNGTGFTVVKIDRKAAISDFQKAKDGNEFIIAEVIIENTDKDKAPYNPLYFKVKDADGFEYNAGFTAGEQSLKSGDLAKGEKARGNVAFEVKKDAKGLILEYKPLVFGQSESIKVSLD